MRRDYKNRRTIFEPSRTLPLSLQILRCNNEKCSRYKRPHRPESEWQYALPGTKFGMTVGGFIFAAHLDGKSNLAIHRAISEMFSFKCASRSMEGVIRRYEKVCSLGVSPWSASVVEKLKRERKAFLDVLVAYDLGSHFYVLVRECFSNCLLAGRAISGNKAEELQGLFRSVIDRLPVPVVQVCCTQFDAVRSVAIGMWPQVPVVEVKTLDSVIVPAERSHFFDLASSD